MGMAGYNVSAKSEQFLRLPWEIILYRNGSQGSEGAFVAQFQHFNQQCQGWSRWSHVSVAEFTFQNRGSNENQSELNLRTQS